MMKARSRRVLLSLLAGVVVAVAAGESGSLWLRAQAADARAVASLMPPGALIYVEAKDFGSLLGQWNGSAEKRRWLGSTNHGVMAVSRLVQRLSQAQGEFEGVAGSSFGMNLVDQIAGGRSGFAFYNLSALSFVYITQLPAGRVEASSLWRDRVRYESREVAGIPFYVKSSGAGARTVAFTAYKDWFVLSSSEDGMAETLVLLSGGKAASLATEPWFSATAGTEAEQGDLRLIYNIQTLLATPQFRTYWIHRNASELKPFAAGISDLFETAAGFEERRTLRRVTEAPAREPDGALGEALAYAPASAALYRAWARPDEAHLSETVRQVVAGERPAAEMYNAPAPEVHPEAGAVGSEADVEARIDEAPFQRSAENSMSALVSAIEGMQPSALLHVQSTAELRGGVFVVPSSAAVVICKQPDRAAFDQALALLPPVERGALDPLQVTVEGNAVVLSRMKVSRSSTPAIALDATYTATYNHYVAWADYKKLFTIIDTHAASPEMPVSNSAPTFFSGDVRSLGDSVARLKSASITATDAGGETVRETVRYEFAQP